MITRKTIGLGSRVRIIREMCLGPRDSSWTAVGMVMEIIYGKGGCTNSYFIVWDDGTTDHFGLHELELAPE